MPVLPPSARAARAARAAARLVVVLVLGCVAALLPVVGPAAPASALSASGVQRLLVVPIAHAHGGCPVPAGTPTNVPQCPRWSASQWQTIFQRDIDSWFRTESYGRASFQVRVLVNPDTADGWWPAPRSRAEYAQNDAFTTAGAIGRDAGELIVGRALRRGLLSRSELGQFQRLIMMDNFHARGGTTYAIGQPITYRPDGTTFTVTASLIPEAANDQETLSLARHELGHQLGLPDLYEQPCTLRPPGSTVRDHRNTAENNCVGPWDHMGLDFWGYPGLGAYTRQRLRWLDPSSSTAVKDVTRAFSGTLTLDPVNRPRGNPLVLRVADSPQLARILETFGNPGPYQGFMVECRRRILNDTGLPEDGLLVTYLDPKRSGWSPLAIARNGTTGVSRAALSNPGDRYTNDMMGLKVTYVGPAAGGGCVVDVNKTRKVYGQYLPIGDLAQVAVSGPASGGSGSVPGFAGTGIVVSGGAASPPPVASRRARAQRALTAPVKGRRATIRFAYANAGARRVTGGTAVVRVNDPYTVTVCGRPAAGRVVGRVRLAPLGPGKVRTGTVRFVPRSSGPIGVSVTITGKGATAPGRAAGRSTGAIAFASATSTASRSTTATTTFRIRAARKGCRGPVVPEVAPLVQPRGWRIAVTGASAPLAPGRTRTVRVVARPATGVAPAALQVPVVVTAGDAGAPADGSVRYGYGSSHGLLLGGLDVMLRVGRPGSLPPFTLARPPRLPAPTAYPSAPPAPATTTLSLTCPSTADRDVTVPGQLSPATAGAAVTLTYVRYEDGATIRHRTSTSGTGAFSDHFDDPRPGWRVTATFAGDGAHAPSTSNTCYFGQVIERPARGS